jgi:hypothetical protein
MLRNPDRAVGTHLQFLGVLFMTQPQRASPRWSPAHFPPADYAASNLMPRGHLEFCWFHKNPINLQLPERHNLG